MGSNRKLQKTGHALLNAQRVKQAFMKVREGRCCEYVICDETLDKRFLATARQLGAKATDAELNTSLLNLRKQNQLNDCKTTRRKTPDPNRSKYLQAVSNAVRMVERQFAKNVDDVICDPETRAQFDAIIQFLAPGISSFEAAYAALSLRKSSQLKPEPIGQVIRTVGSKAIDLLELEAQLSKIPARPGVYIFFDDHATLYAGKADSLRARIRQHASSWSFREMVRQIRDGERAKAFVVYHELPVTISARELAACELELIRSRKPEHNRSGRDA